MSRRAVRAARIPRGGKRPGAGRGRGGLPRAALVLSGALLLSGALVPPVVGQEPAAAEAEEEPEVPGAPLSAYGLLALDGTTGQLGLAVASGRFSAGSGLVFLDPARGAALVLGRMAPEAGRRAVRALADGLGPDSAARVAAAGAPEGVQVAVLDTGCRSGVAVAGDSLPWTGSRTGDAGSVCWLAAGSLLADGSLVDRMAAGFRGSGGEMPQRLLAGLEAAERGREAVGRVTSAALWVAAGEDGEPVLGRPELRLQVESSQNPSAALRHLLRAGRADALAARAHRRVEEEEYERAVELADRAIELEPATALAWLSRGRALLYLGRREEAETALQRMLEVNPFLLNVLGDPLVPRPRRGAMPYDPRLLERLDVYRKAFFPEIEFPADTAEAAADTLGLRRAPPGGLEARPARRSGRDP